MPAQSLHVVLSASLVMALSCDRVKDPGEGGGDGGAGDQVDGAPGAIDAGTDGPNLVVSPSSHVFGSVPLDTESTQVAFMFTNTGNAPVTGCGLPEFVGDHPNDFAVKSDGCEFGDLEPGESCTVTVVAKPQVEGHRRATLSRTCTAGGTASTDANALFVNKVMYIFISSTTYDGNLGGFDGADATCEALAAAGSLTSGLDVSWKALLSKSTGGVVHARERFVWTGPLEDVNGNRVTQNPAVWPWQDDGGANASIEFNESGGGPGTRTL